LSVVEGQAVRSIPGSAGSTPRLSGGMMVPGQTAAQSGAQLSAQQSIPSWPPAILEEAISEECAIGQSGDGKANAGPDTMAMDRASQIRAQRRHMSFRVNDAPAGGNALTVQELNESQSETPSRRFNAPTEHPAYVSLRVRPSVTGNYRLKDKQLHRHAEKARACWARTVEGTISWKTRTLELTLASTNLALSNGVS
jgi:hypothetical protein